MLNSTSPLDGESVVCGTGADEVDQVGGRGAGEHRHRHGGAPNLSEAEASRLREAVREAGLRLRRRLTERERESIRAILRTYDELR